MAWRNPYFDPSKPHHRPGGFTNLDPAARIGGDVGRWRRERRQQQLPRAPQAGYEAFARQWTVAPDFTAAAGDAPHVWWLGHASVLLRIGGRTVLTDPVFSPRASPLSFAGPARRVPAVVTVADLPPIDVVLISHNHYDHLDRASVRALAARSPDTLFAVPLGLATVLRRFGARRVQELDWWQAHSALGLDVHAVPAQHWSARTLWDRNRSLWCGFTVHAGGVGFYFAGDTGYWRQAAEIPRRTGAIDLAALPIGAYAPRWFMQAQHVDPAQAVQLHRDLAARQSLAIHWGSFELADEALDEPPEKLREALRDAGLSDQRDFWLLAQGADRAL